MLVHLPLYQQAAKYNATPGNTNYIFSGGANPTGLSTHEDCVLVRVAVMVGGGSTLILGMSDGTTVISGTLNLGTALSASQWYTFEFEARKAYTYDFKLGTAVTLNALFVSEVGGGAS